MANVFEEFLGGAGKSKAAPDLTSERIADALDLIAETMDCTRSDTMDELERIAEAIEAGNADDEQGYPQ